MILLSSAAGPSFIQGFDFRGTLGYVTDPPNCIGVVPTSGGWNGSPGGADRTTANDHRVCGAVYSNASACLYVITLPAPGTYTVNLAAADPGGSSVSQISVRDGNLVSSPILITVTQPGGQFADANGTLYANAAAWVAANPVGGLGAGGKLLTFTSTYCGVHIVNNGTFNVLSHFMIQH